MSDKITAQMRYWCKVLAQPGYHLLRRGPLYGWILYPPEGPTWRHRQPTADMMTRLFKARLLYAIQDPSGSSEANLSEAGKYLIQPKNKTTERIAV